MRSVLGIALVLSAFGCRSQPPPTYSALIEKHCVRCHSGATDGTSVPPSLATEEDVRANAALIALSTRRRTMPPWPADSSGACGSFRGATALSAAEIATLQSWTATEVHRRQTNGLTDASLVLAAAEPFVPSLGAGGHRCFVLPPRNTSAQITAVGSLTNGFGPVDQLELYSVEGDPPSCDQVPTEAQLIASWSSVSPVLELPKGTAMLLPANRPLILRAHAELSALGTAREVKPQLALTFGEGRLARFVPLSASKQQLCAGQKETFVHGELVASSPLRVHGLVPRMGPLGRTLTVERTDGCVAYFGHWNPYQSQLFVFEEPIELRTGDKLSISCSYNTVSLERDVPLEADECRALLYATDY